jgi:GTP-binding protein
MSTIDGNDYQNIKIAIIGRPNVGKSTLFNRLIGKNLAIVHDLPGVTRDRKEGQGAISDFSFMLFDTAGLEDSYDNSIEGRMRRQTEMAIDEADLIFFLIDARAGVTPLDSYFAHSLRKTKKPILLIANKCEGKAGLPGLHESYALGFGQPIPFSAEHGEGLDRLYEALIPYFNRQKDQTIESSREPHLSEIFPEDLDRPIDLVVVGRPNVGKSTLINHLLGQERLLTGPEAGLTRDSISIDWHYNNKKFRLIDTAGMRRRAKIHDSLEKLSVSSSLAAIRRSQVVILLMDCDAILDKQDLTIGRMVIEEGRALIIAINKWDQVTEPQRLLKQVQERLETSLPQVRGIPVVTLSALTGRGISDLMKAVETIYSLWTQRIATAQLNRWLQEMTERHPPPAINGHRIKLRYMTQVKARPPTFALFSQRTDDLPDSYNRFLMNGLRDYFDLKGVPLRIVIRKRANPYVDET